MNTQTAADITRAIADVGDLKLRLTALENVLQVREPELFAAYAAEIANLRSSKAHQIFEISLQGLQKRLESQ
jgi:hypothetical protein